MKIALIGRPNVGKSSLFNRLLESRQALESDIPSTTRDQNRGFLYVPLLDPSLEKTKHSLKSTSLKIELIDTPGLNPKTWKMKHETKITAPKTDSLEILEYNIQLQAKRALEEADLILYLIDYKIEPTSEDQQIIRKLRRASTPILLVVNKADKPADQIEAIKYLKLGLGEPIAVSAKNGRGTNNLLEKISRLAEKNIRLHATPQQSLSSPSANINVAIIGKPNVGKSSLFNALLKEERVVVSPLPHTTRDPNNTEISYRNYLINLVDTAGLRKKARLYQSDQIEIFSAQKTLNSISKADVALLILAISEGVSTQDLKISRLLKEKHCGLIIIANKWDQIPDKDNRTLAQTRKYLYQHLKSMDWAPLIFSDVKKPTEGKIFGLEKKYLDQSEIPSRQNPLGNPLYKLLDLVITVYQNRKQYLPPEQLSLILRQAIKKQPPPKSKGAPRARITALEQINQSPPVIKLTLGNKTPLPNHYLGYLKNQLRKHFRLEGTTVSIKIVDSL